MRWPISVATMLATYAAAWGLALVARARAPRSVPAGRCEGLGWGCELTPYDGWTFAMVLVLAPMTVGCVVLSLGWLVARRRRPAHPVVRGLTSVAFAVPTAIVLALATGGILGLDG